MNPSPRILALPLALAMLAGCGPGAKQLAAARSFGASTVSVSRMSIDEMARARSSIISMNTLVLALDSTVKPHHYAIDDPVSFDAVEVRNKACRALELYGALLVELASDDPSDSLAATAALLVDDAQAAMGTSLDPAIGAATAKALSEVGSIVTEARRLRALRQIVSSWRAPIDSMARLLEADFSLVPGSSGILSANVTMASALRARAIDILSTPGRNALERDLAAQSLETALRAQERARELSRQASVLLAELGEVNAQLQSALSSRRPSIDAVAAFASRARAIVDLQRTLSR